MKRIARVVIEERDVNVSGKEQDRGGGIEHFAGNPLRLEVLFTRLDTIITDPAATAVAAAILADDFTGGSFADTSTGTYDTSVTGADWNAKSKASAVLEFGGEQMELPIPTGENSQRYVVIFYFDDYTFGWCYLTVRRDGIPATPAPSPNQAGNIVPGNAVYDGTGSYTRAVTAGQFYLVGFAAHDTSLVNGTDTITATLTNFQAQGSSVTLHGTPGATVTAAIRSNPTLTAGEIIALIHSLAGTLAGQLTGGGSPEGAVTGARGQFYWDYTNKSLWVKQNPAGNTGWQQLIA